MSGLAAFDILTVVLLIVFALYGLLRGMVRLVLGFAALILGWILALRWCETGAVWLRKVIPASGGDRGFDGHRIAAFVIIFVAIVIAMGLVSWLITHALGSIRLGAMNRLAGATLGLLVGIVVVCAATVPLLALAPPDGGPLMGRSRLAPYAVAGGEYLKVVAPEPMRRQFTTAAKTMLDTGAAMVRKAGEAAREINAPKPAPSPHPR